MSKGITLDAWAGSYEGTVHFDDKTVKQTVSRLVLATQFGVVHFKVCEFRSGKKKVFTDTSWGKPRWWDIPNHWNAIQVEKDWGRCNRDCAKHGTTFSSQTWLDTEEADADIREMIGSDPVALAAWDRLRGEADREVLKGILDRAEDIVKESRAEHLASRAMEMAAVDEKWGMF